MGEIEAMVAIVAAYINHNAITIGDIPALIAAVQRAVSGQPGAPDSAAPVELAPAVPIKKSIKPDHIVCLEDGKKLKMLKRHLKTTYNLTPNEYRAKWGLPADYPMVAPNYAKTRSDLALKAGLGRRAAA